MFIVMGGFDLIGSVVIILMLSCLKGIKPMHNSNSTLLDDMLQEYAHNSLPTHPHTGLLYNASLPSNVTGIEVSMVRLRWDSFRRKGANYSVFHMPPQIFVYPYFTRIDIVYSNLGNRSSDYYNVPNHTLVAPVVGFNIYGSPGQNGNLTKLNLTLFGGPILVQIPPVPEKAKCVMFYSNGTFEMSEVAPQDICVVQDQGHFSMVVELPSTSTPKDKDKDKDKERRKLWRWWVFGFGFGLGVLGFLLVVFMMIRIFRIWNIGKMEKEAEKNEVLETTNVGQSKMPIATVVRTQPVIENDSFLAHI